ncbi:uncharacterized protein LOC107746835 [Sinocyclocheilus rhinocerous]|uniref:uncharacterized protein LOC107746835 n=1 Tax=Sinocyclocheilus rhinocerous TaxID=307959 RepID=UPI0007B90BC1|nr:PREDICTED: uncharacterized protein LOC107746835 [Sinocyclocheilus rhinocerous]
MADHSSGTSEQHSSEVSETLVSSNEFLKPHMQDSDGHTANSPEESLSPASVIYFKEALTYNSSIQFTKTSCSSLPAPVRYEFQIEKTNKKTRSLSGAVPPSTICSRDSHNPPQHRGSHLGQHPPICSACSQSGESKRLGCEGGTEREKETSLIVAPLRLTQHLNPLAVLSQRALKPLFTRRILAVAAHSLGEAIESQKNSILSARFAVDCLFIFSLLSLFSLTVFSFSFVLEKTLAWTGSLFLFPAPDSSLRAVIVSVVVVAAAIS